MFAQSLGREPKEYEKQNLLDQYSAIIQKQTANQQRVAGLIEEPEFQTVEELVNYSNHGIEDIQETILEEGITQIDPAARFQQAFKDATQFETERLRGQDDIQRTNQTILNLISGAPG
jgi:Cu2+-containing amine oxidase